MPVDPKDLLRVVTKAVEYRHKEGRLGGSFVSHFSDFCVEELSRLGLKGDTLEAGRSQKFKYELKRFVIGGSYPKEVDVVFESNTSGPLLGISLKAPNSSIFGNVNSRLEEMAGEAANLHGRFPMLVLGHITVLPFKDLKGPLLIDSKGHPTIASMRYVNKLYGISGRESPNDADGTFEEVGVAFFNYDHRPPAYSLAYPFAASSSRRSIRLDDFFDRMITRMQERNPLLFPDTGGAS